MKDYYYTEPIRKPKTIDVLETRDCLEIIINDLKRYGVPESATSNLLDDYFIPMKNEIIRLKKEYGKKCFANSPDNAFFD
ncbi:MAG: hypothetical protein J6B23_00270 [Clostridia bacterium]|nr:hypothetical protein [Clostridia bacterium]